MILSDTDTQVEKWALPIIMRKENIQGNQIIPGMILWSTRIFDYFNTHEKKIPDLYFVIEVSKIIVTKEINSKNLQSKNTGILK